MPTIEQVQTAAAKREVRQFWYEVYCVVRGVLRDVADHGLRELDDPLVPHAKLFVARDRSGAVCGSVMATYARDCDLGGYAQFYELSRLPADRDGIAIVTKLMTSTDARGTGVALALLRAVTAAGVRDNITHAVYDANSPTDALFQRVGGVDWLGIKHHPDFGDVRVMVTRLADDRHILSAPGHPLAQCFPASAKDLEEIDA